MITTDRQTPLLSIIVPTIGRMAELHRLLKSIESQSLPTGQYEILLISKTYLSEVAQLSLGYPKLNIAYLQTHKPGVNVSRNLGLKVAGGEILFFLDDDCELINRRHLSELEHTLKLFSFNAESKIAGCGGAYICDNPTSLFAKAYHEIACSWLNRQILATNNNDKHNQEKRPQEQNCMDGFVFTKQLFGGNAAYLKSKIKDIWFRDAIKFGGAEEEFNYQIILNGDALLRHDKFDVGHNLEVSFTQFCKKAYLQGFWYGERRHRGLHAGDCSLDVKDDLQIVVKQNIKGDIYNQRTPFLIRILMALYNLIFNIAAEQRGERTYIHIFRAIYAGAIKTPLLVNLARLRTISMRIYNWLVWTVGWFFLWRVLWNAIYPIRKIYYICNYQYRKRVLPYLS